MRDYRQLLATFIEVVTFLLAAFGGFLKNVAPPDQVGASFPVGMLSFLTLIVLMIISALGRQSSAKDTSRKWVLAGAILFALAVPSAFAYRHMVSNFTYPHQLDLAKRKISAPDAYLTADARQYKLTNPDTTPEELARNLPEGDVWTVQAITKVGSQLLGAYACLVLSLSASIFCLLEANMRANGNGSKPRQSNPDPVQDPTH
jgi:hypothetical protein